MPESRFRSHLDIILEAVVQRASTAGTATCVVTRRGPRSICLHRSTTRCWPSSGKGWSYVGGAVRCVPGGPQMKITTPPLCGGIEPFMMHRPNKQSLPCWGCAQAKRDLPAGEDHEDG